MNQQQSNRVAEIIIGTVGAATLTVSSAEIAFSILKTPTSESNKATVDIYNLSSASRAKISELDQVVTVSAGYSNAGGLEVIFVGDITLINHQHNRPNIVTRLELNDGERILRESKLSLSYKEGFSTRQILMDILSKLSVPQKIDLTKLQFTDKKFSNGYSFVGQAKVALDTLTKTVGLEWSFQNGELKIQPDGSVDFTRAIVLNKDTGLIGSPERLENIGKKSKKEKVKPGWKVLSLLQPKAEPGGIVTLESREIPKPTQFRIEEVEHRGQVRGSEWNTSMKVVELK